MIIKYNDWLAHYGTPRKSGRYPWGSGGKDQKVYEGSFLDITTKLLKNMSQKEVADGFGITTSELRIRRSIESNERRNERDDAIRKLAEKGHSPSEIGRQLGRNESSVRSAMASMNREKAATIHTIADVLQKDVDKHGYIQIGAGVEHLPSFGISASRLNNAVGVLKEKGYVVHPVQVEQQGTPGQFTTVKVLARPGTTYRDAKANRDQIRIPGSHSEDGGRTFEPNFKPPIHVDPKRILVKYKDDGGADADGTLFVRPGVPDISIGGKNYAQVRVAVGGTHYMKGVAVYKKDLPDGVDIQYNTNKERTKNKLDALKPLRRADGKDGTDTSFPVDDENPFGSQITRQVTNEHGKVTSAMNIINEEGTWAAWKKDISSQVLSKQSPLLAKQQLELKHDRLKTEFEEIKSLTNPVIRLHLLEKFASSADSSAVHLEAANLPRQQTHVILPVKSLKSNEVYAPNYNNGENVVLIRFPHGGKFEIPSLLVNNKNREAAAMMGKTAPDAIGVHPKVAERLSGADFDGDTVLVIPNNPKNPRRIETEPPLKALEKFDPHSLYKLSDDVPKMKDKKKGLEMGKISNLITDMTIHGASNEELARAVKHSMVVIDAQKHHLDWKKSERDFAIPALVKKYQEHIGPDGRVKRGASTLISRSGSEEDVPETRPARVSEGGPIDPKTGRLRMVPKTFITKDGTTVQRMVKVNKLANTSDAHTLVSTKRTAVEVVYADHSNRLKALANEARKEIYAFKPPKHDLHAKRVYKAEVDSLLAKLRIAKANAPLERQAQLLASIVVSKQMEANPNMDKETIKKIRGQALATARVRTGASKTKVIPTAEEWAAIQAGAVSHNVLKQILANSDVKALRQLATPRVKVSLTPAKIARAKSMKAQGYNQAEIAEALGVSPATIREQLSG